MQNSAQRKPSRGSDPDQARRGVRVGDVSTLDLDIGPASLKSVNRLLCLWIGLRPRGQHNPPASSVGHHRGEEKAESADTSGDDV